MLQVEFPDNYMTIWLDQTQSAYCQKNQVTAFTSVCWNGLEHQSSVNISDDLSYTKGSIVIFID